MAAPQRRSRGHSRRGRIVDRRATAWPVSGPAGGSGSPRARPSPASSRRRRWPTATRSTSRTCAATSSRSTARPERCAGSGATARGTTGRTASPWKASECTAPRTRTPSRSPPRPDGSCGGGTLTSRSEQFVDIAPVAWKGLVFLSTVGYAPFGRGAIYALDAATGAVRWKFVTIERPWRYPLEAGGGGLWYPGLDRLARPAVRRKLESVAVGRHTASGRTAAPFRARPCTRTRCSCSTHATGRLLWHDQVTPHDVRDYDFQATPILATQAGVDLVLGAGKAGRVIAWNRETRRRRWTAVVGLHRNDVGPLPRRRVTVCPGPARRRRDADGLRGRPAVRPGRRPLRLGQRRRAPGGDRARPVERTWPPRRARRGDGTHAVGAAPALAGLRLRDGRRTTSSSPPPTTGRCTRWPCATGRPLARPHAGGCERVSRGRGRSAARRRRGAPAGERALGSGARRVRPPLTSEPPTPC